jgi:uncharacterized damage-inducible protein DinB
MNLLEKYLQGYEILKGSIEGLTPEQMKTVPGTGKWSIHEIIIHVVDADLMYAGRIKRTLAEENTILLPFDQDAWAKHLYYHQTDLQTHLELFRLLRESTAQVLRNIEAADWEKKGHHPEVGELTVQQLVEALIEHVATHVRRVKTIRAQLFT